MNTKVEEKQKEKVEISELRKKAAFFDEIMEFIENKALADLMAEVENEKNIPFEKLRN